MSYLVSIRWIFLNGEIKHYFNTSIFVITDFAFSTIYNGEGVKS